MVRNANRAATATMQAQKSAQETVTETKSVNVVKNIIRASLSEICYLRGLFEEEHFQDKQYAGLKIKTIEAASRDPETGEVTVHDEDAHQLTQWLEKGAFPAIERRYLKQIVFSVYELCPAAGDMLHEEGNLLETYTYKIVYPPTNSKEEEENATIQPSLSIKKGNSNDGRAGGGSAPSSAVHLIKNEAMNMIRCLISLCNSLDPLPADRVLKMFLYYNEDITPPEWQPEFFEDCDASGVSFDFGDTKALKIPVGKLSTPYHTMSMKLRTRESSCGGGGADDMEEDADSTTNRKRGRTGSSSSLEEEDEGEDSASSSSVGDGEEAEGESEEESEEDSSSEEDEEDWSSEEMSAEVDDEGATNLASRISRIHLSSNCDGPRPTDQQQQQEERDGIEQKNQNQQEDDEQQMEEEEDDSEDEEDDDETQAPEGFLLYNAIKRIVLSTGATSINTIITMLSPEHKANRDTVRMHFDTLCEENVLQMHFDKAKRRHYSLVASGVSSPNNSGTDGGAIEAAAEVGGGAEGGGTPTNTSVLPASAAVSAARSAAGGGGDDTDQLLEGFDRKKEATILYAKVIIFLYGNHIKHIRPQDIIANFCEVSTLKLARTILNSLCDDGIVDNSRRSAGRAVSYTSETEKVYNNAKAHLASQQQQQQQKLQQSPGAPGGGGMGGSSPPSSFLDTSSLVPDTFEATKSDLVSGVGGEEAAGIEEEQQNEEGDGGSSGGGTMAAPSNLGTRSCGKRGRDEDYVVDSSMGPSVSFSQDSISFDNRLPTVSSSNGGGRRSSTVISYNKRRRCSTPSNPIRQYGRLDNKRKISMEEFMSQDAV